MEKIGEDSMISVYVMQGQLKSEYKTTEKKTILKLLQESGAYHIQALCGGGGTCGKCLVKVKTGQETRNVLACQTQICDDMCIILESESQMAVAENGACMHYPADGVHTLAAACDIGTTTVVCHLLDGRSGERLATVSAPNAQRVFGADVVSRIQASADGMLGQMHDAVIEQLNGMLSELCETAGVGRKIDYLAVAGNTVMCHILAGLAPDSIGTAPFTPQSLFGEEMDGAAIGLEHIDKVYIAPAAAGYVGGDITAGMLSIGMDTSGRNEPAAMETNMRASADMGTKSKASADMETKSNVPVDKRAVSNVPDSGERLFVDIGTNGEIVLGSNGDYLCCAAAAGPAFEGAQITLGMPACTGAVSKVWVENGRIRVSVIGGGEAEGICGSGLVDALAVFLKAGLMDATGCVTEKSEAGQPYDSYIGVQGEGACIYLTDKVYVTQADIRQMQMAKAAIAAGIQILLKERGISDSQVGELVLAGGFGSFLDLENAAAVGLIPKKLLPIARSVGNAAGEGAVSAALSIQAREKLTHIQNKLKYIELSAHPLFFDEYIEQMEF